MCATINFVKDLIWPCLSLVVIVLMHSSTLQHSPGSKKPACLFLFDCSIIVSRLQALMSGGSFEANDILSKALYVLIE